MYNILYTYTHTHTHTHTYTNTHTYIHIHIRPVARNVYQGGGARPHKMLRLKCNALHIYIHEYKL